MTFLIVTAVLLTWTTLAIIAGKEETNATELEAARSRIRELEQAFEQVTAHVAVLETRSRKLAVAAQIEINNLKKSCGNNWKRLTALEARNRSMALALTMAGEEATGG